MTSAELEGSVSVWVDSAPGPLAHVVYRVDVPGRELVAATNIYISGTTARIVPGPGPAGTVATIILRGGGRVVGQAKVVSKFVRYGVRKTRSAIGDPIGVDEAGRLPREIIGCAKHIQPSNADNSRLIRSG